MILFSSIVTGVNRSRAENIDLFVMAGQSNMQGWMGDAKMYPPDDNGVDGKTRFYWVFSEQHNSRNKWTSMRSQTGRFPKGHFGPEVSFARCLAEAGYNPAIFKYSHGGTGLKNDWKAPGENGMYDKMVLELDKAVQLLEKEGHHVSLRGFVWVQGESDAITEKIAKGYGERLKLLVTHFREKVANNLKLPFILGVDEQHPWVKKHPQVVKHQQKLAEEDPHIIFTSMKGLAKADTTHLAPAGLVEHGKRLFKAFVQLINTNEATTKGVGKCRKHR